MRSSELLKDNSLELTVNRINTGQYYIAEIYEYNLSDTVLLTSDILDRAATFTLTFKPSGSNNIGMILKTTNALSTTSTIKLKNFYTTVTTYTAQSITSTICNNGGDRYRFGYNGQEKVNEIAGIGNHNTAEFWEYDTRLGRRWNLDPITQSYISSYACFDNSPVWLNDVLGDEPTNGSSYKGKEIIVKAKRTTSKKENWFKRTANKVGDLVKEIGHKLNDAGERVNDFLSNLFDKGTDGTVGKGGTQKDGTVLSGGKGTEYNPDRSIENPDHLDVSDILSIAGNRRGVPSISTVSKLANVFRKSITPLKGRNQYHSMDRFFKHTYKMWEKMTKNSSFWSTPIKITSNIKNEIDINTTSHLKVTKVKDTFNDGNRIRVVFSREGMPDSILYTAPPEHKKPSDYPNE